MLAGTPIGKIDHGDTEKRRLARFARRAPLLRVPVVNPDAIALG
jgi:hypothetical protein